MNKIIAIMKKYLLFFTALIATTVTFTACSSEEDLAENAGQELEQERGVVKTQFTISIPQGTSGTTRMASDMVQSTEALNDFRGIKGIELYPFKTKISTTTGSEFPTASTTIPSKILLVGATGHGKNGPSGSSDYTIGGPANLYNTSKSHLYQDVDIPIGTESFMFYGEAAGEAAESVQGKLNKTASGSTLGGITFSPAPIHEAGTVGSYGTKIATYLTSIANATVGTGASAKKWIQTSNVALRSLFEQFTGEAENHSLSNNGVKAGSWTNVKAALQELYKNLEVKEGSAETQDTKDMKNAIRAAIANSEYGVTASGNTLSFIKDEDTNPDDDVHNYTSVMSVIADPQTGKETPYPRDLGLPDGAAHVRWNVSSQEFEALADNSYTGSNFASLGSYVYPASLYYRVLSNIKTSSTIKGVGTSGYNDDATWSQILAYYNQTTQEATENYDNESVSSKTRSIVITDPVQYAVGRLDATIMATSANIKDNPNTTANTNPEFNVGSESTLFKVTGILVGGQKPVDYKFEQKSSETTFYTIYDHSIGDVYLRSSNSSPIYTLALETKSASGSSDESAIVKIAVEFENNSGRTIVGKNKELIYPGCRFYLIGTLDPNDNTDQKYAGTNTLINKAFVQDYKTIVTLKISSLQNAYNTLPDLTLPQLEMGLSVDLSWKTGITQVINME